MTHAEVQGCAHNRAQMPLPQLPHAEPTTVHGGKLVVVVLVVLTLVTVVVDVVGVLRARTGMVGVRSAAGCRVVVLEHAATRATVTGTSPTASPPSRST